MRFFAVLPSLLLQLGMGFQSGTAFGAANPAYDPASDLYLAFQGNCSSVGRLTNQALQQSSALRDILVKLRDDVNCQGISALMTQFVNLEEKLGASLSVNSQDWTRHQYDRQINDLMAAVGSETDSNSKSLLMSELAQVRVNSISVENGGRLSRRKMVYQDASKLVSYSRQLLTALNADQSCLQNRSGLAAQITGQVMAVGSSLISSPVGPALLAGGALVDAFSKFFQNRPYASGIRDIQVQRMGPAIGCAFEAIAQNYCRARDTEKLVTALANPKKFERSEREEWIGLDLLFGVIEAFNEATNRLVAGAPPSNPSIARRKNRAETLEATLRAIQNRVEGTLLESKIREERLDTKDRINNRRKTIAELHDDLESMVIESGQGFFNSRDGINDNSPLAQFFSFDPTCGPITYLTVRGTTRERNGNGGGGGGECKSYLDNEIPEFAAIEANLKDILTAGRRFVATEVGLIRENDLQAVLAAFEMSRNPEESGRNFILEALTYLRALENRSPPPSRFIQALIDDTIQRMERARVLLDTPQTSIEILRATVTDLAEQLTPAQDSLYIFKRFQQIVRWDLNHFIRSGRIKDDFEFIFQSTLDDSFSVMSGLDIDQLQPALRDARLAQTVSISNLQSLSKNFLEVLNRFMKGLFRGPGNVLIPAVETSKTSLCMQLLSDPTIVGNKHAIQKACIGRLEASIYDDHPLKLNFDLALQFPFQDRVCALFDFDRKVRIHGSRRERTRLSTNSKQ